MLIAAVFLAGTLASGPAFAQTNDNGTDLLGQVRDLVQGVLDQQQEQQPGEQQPGDQQAEQQQEPQSQILPLDLADGLLLGDPAIEVPLQAAAVQQQDIIDPLPIGDQISSDPVHAPGASDQPLSDSLAVGDGIEAQTQKGAVSVPVLLDDRIAIVDNAAHASANKIARGITDTLMTGDSLFRDIRVSPVITNPPHSNPSPQSPPPQNPIGNTVPPKPAHVARSIVDAINMGDLSAGRGPSSISTQSELRVIDNIALSGLVVPPAAPKISVTSPPILQVTPDQDAEMTFHSTTPGTYSIAIKNDDSGQVARTLDGEMNLGANAVTWDGKDAQGNVVPAGGYSYYIKAHSTGGTREAPAEGDGAIVVVGAPRAPGDVQLPVDTSYLLILPVVAAAGVASFFFLRRKKPLTFYLPEEASAVIEDIRSRYPDAAVEDYVETTEEGIRRYKGVTIRNAKEADDDWLAEVADKAKKLAGVDSVNVNYRGKTIAL